MARSSLHGQHALVTGGGRGIGAAVAARLSAEGARVSILGRSLATLQAAVARGEAALALAADVTDDEAVRAVVAQAVQAAGPVRILVANAGGAESAPFLKTGPDMFRRMLDLNLMGVVHPVQAVLPAMQQAGSGRIIAIASTAALKGYPFTAAYTAAKHAVLGLVRVLALETARTGVTVNAVCPGFTDTGLVEESAARIIARTGRSREEALAELTRFNPQGRLVSPAEVADAVCWLCRPEAAAISGQAIAVDGAET
jgi:NAD(P)-dependent dehydrogenase (short-subunit alcohol dehydrogenase family)